MFLWLNYGQFHLITNFWNSAAHDVVAAALLTDATLKLASSAHTCQFQLQMATQISNLAAFTQPSVTDLLLIFHVFSNQVDSLYT